MDIAKRHSLLFESHIMLVSSNLAASKNAVVGAIQCPPNLLAPDE